MSKLLLVAVAAALAVPAGGAGSGSVPPNAICVFPATNPTPVTVTGTSAAWKLLVGV